MKILVVDDSRAMRMIVTRTLRQAGFTGHEIIEAENGRLGLEAFRSEDPDLVLSDGNMPEMTGIDFLRAVRATGSSTPFCFVTSDGSEEMRTRAEKAGALGVIVKPFTPEAFGSVLAPVVT